MQVLKSFDADKEYFDLSKCQFIEILSPVKFVGWYKVVSEIFTGLIVESQALYFLFGDKRIIVDHLVHSKLIDLNTTNSCLEIYRKDDLIVRMPYQKDKSLYGIAPFEYIDEEDFDWGLFLMNIINSPQRKTGIIKALSDQ